MGDAALVALEAQRAPPSAVLASVAGRDVDEVELIRTLGRLRHVDALPALEASSMSADAEVVAAAAEALGRTPGGLGRIRAGVAQIAAGTSVDVAAAWLDALGRQGDGSDVAALVDRLRDRAPVARAATLALGRMGRRKLEGVSAAVPALAEALDRPDVVSGAAFALFRVGMGSASSQAVSAALRCASGAAEPEARAWCTRAVWPRLGPSERATRFVEGVTDPARLVRVAALDAVDTGDVDVDLVAPWRTSREPQIAAAALAALGRLDEAQAREVLADVAMSSTDPWRVAAALTALGRPDRVRAADPAVDAVVRAALVQLETDTSALVRIAVDDLDSRVRVAAAAALADRPSVGWNTGIALLASSDLVVREVAMTLVGERGGPEAARALLPAVQVESARGYGEALHQGVVALAALCTRHVRALDPRRDTAVRDIVANGLRAPTARTRAAAAALATALGLPANMEAPTAPVDLPLQAAVWVRTTRGDFAVELDAHTAPLAVGRFLGLVAEDALDGDVFHRVVPGFVVQTGCPRGDGWGGVEPTLPDEPSLLPFDVGAVGIARSDLDSGSSQWFVTLSDQPHLVGDYTRIGRVVSGMHVVERIGQGDRVLDVEAVR